MTTTTDSANESLAVSSSSFPLPQHIRPTKRSPQQNLRPSSSSAPRASAAVTEAKIQSWTKLAEGETTWSTTSSSYPAAANNTPRLNSASSSTATVVGPGILRAKPKYSGGSSPLPRPRTATTTATRTTTSITNTDAAEEVDNNNNNDYGDAAPAVRSLVVERPRRRTTTPRPAGRPSSSLSSLSAAAAIDGYTPRTRPSRADVPTIPPPTGKAASTAAATASATTGGATTTTAKEQHQEEEPLVFNSLADMMALAGTLPSDSDAQKEPPYMVEAELQFSCADPDEFQRQQQQQSEDDHERLASHVNTVNENDDDDDDEENVRPLQDHDTDDDSAMGDDDLLDFLGGGGDDGEEESTSTAPPRAFLQLWTALAQWATPEAVTWIQNWRQCGGKNHPNVVTLTVDVDDVCASRCAGLWSQLPREHAWRALQRPEHHRIAAEQRLADLLRCFQYQRPVTLASVDLYRALACVLLEMVVIQDQNDGIDVRLPQLPEPCRKLGMTVEEYRYLTQSALINLGDASTAVVDDAMPNSNNNSRHTNSTGVVEQ